MLLYSFVRTQNLSCLKYSAAVGLNGATLKYNFEQCLFRNC